VTRSAEDLVSATRETSRLMAEQVEGLRGIRDTCANRCAYDSDVVKKMEELYKPVNEANCRPLCPQPQQQQQKQQKQQPKNRCRGAPAEVPEAGLTRMDPSSPPSLDQLGSAPVGGALVYLCQNGMRLPDQGRSLRLDCRDDGRFAYPPAWPKCT